MNKFEKWFLKSIFRKEVRQGYNHSKKIEELYGMIRKACEIEFMEDNAPTMDAFLKELFDKTQYANRIDEFDVLWKKMDLEKESPTTYSIARHCYEVGKQKGNVK